jgi:hypothetical protein
LRHHQLECDSMQWVVGLGIGHRQMSRRRDRDAMRKSAAPTICTLLIEIGPWTS